MTRVLAALLLVSTILSSNSGAVAQEASAGVVVVDGNMWALEASEPLPWSEADEFCDTLEVAGFTDWRLPLLAELESLHDPEAERSIRGPFDLDDCCAWSSMSLVDLEPGQKANLPGPGGPPGGYYWGFLFRGGVAYYSNGRFPDGSALCMREADDD